MRTIILFIILTAVMQLTSAAQDRRRVGDALPEARTGRLYITPMPGQVPSSLNEMIELSTLIVDATVKSVLPSRKTSPKALETDALITVNETLKGPESVREFVIFQDGGVLGDWGIVPAQYSLVEPGERYLLFLKEDERAGVPELSGMKRYRVTGIWSGLFRFKQGRMQVDQPDPLRSRYQGLTPEQVKSEVTRMLRP